MIDWSHDLCAPSTRLLWNRLAVFPGSFDVDAAEKVCGFGALDRAEVFDAIDRLVSQSILLTQRDVGVIRYRLLAAVREYALEKLTDSGEYPELRRRHRDFVLAEAAEVFHGRVTASHTSHADVITALHWSTSTQGEAKSGLELAVLLGWHWVAEGYLDEGRRWLEILLEEGATDAAERANAIWAVIWVALIQNDRDGAWRHLEELERLAETLPGPRPRNHLDHWTGLYHAFSDEPARGVAPLERAVRGHAQADDGAHECIALFQLAFALLCDDQLTRALEVAEQALEASTALHLWRSRDWARWIAGVTRWRLGDLDTAERDVRKLLITQRRSRDFLCAAASTALLGWIAASRGDEARAAELQALSDAVFEDIGTSLAFFGPRIVRFAGHRADDRPAADPAARIRDADELVDRALGPAPTPAPTAGPLTSREEEVARLIAQGLSNKAIAERLVISRRTAEGHVERIIRKLGVTSRAGVASWVVRRDT